MRDERLLVGSHPIFSVAMKSLDLLAAECVTVPSRALSATRIG
ncbi:MULTISPECIES: hypothetical protein [Streptomyces]|nr:MULTISPECIES: hypothetical protein [Streptomyces]